MKAQKALEIAVRNPDYLTISGSRLYGTSRPQSDHDFRGFVLPPFEYLLGVHSFKDAELEGDHKVYSLHRFLDLASKGDPQLTELFFVPEEQVIHRTPLAERVLSLRESVVTNKVYRRIMGYGYSEWRKAMGVKMIVADRTKDEDSVITDIRNTFKPDKDEMDDVIAILNKRKKKKLVPSKTTLGSKRKKEFEEFGFGVSSAAHAIRLVGQLKELMLTGTIKFPRPDADTLKAIRYGKVTPEEATKMYEEIKDEAEKARDNSILPKDPDYNTINKVYLEIVKDFLHKDDRFVVEV